MLGAVLVAAGGAAAEEEEEEEEERMRWQYDCRLRALTVLVVAQNITL